MAERLGNEDIEARLDSLNSAGAGWEVRGDRIARSFSFPDFVTAFGFMAEIASQGVRLIQS